MLSKHVTLSDSTTWTSPDQSVSIKNMYCKMYCRVFHVNRFGRYAVGSQFESCGLVTSVTIRLFGLDALSDLFDAYVCVTFKQADGTAQTRGFHTQAKHSFTFDITVFTKRKVKGLDAAGSCPICLESDIEKMFPMQHMACGHGLCTRCFVSCSSSIRECPCCRAPVQLRLSDIPYFRLHELNALLEEQEDSRWASCMSRLSIASVRNEQVHGQGRACRT